MSGIPDTLTPIAGVDRATPAAESQPGSCLSIENLVPVGPPSAPYWSVVTPSETKEDSSGNPTTGILSLGRQSRERIGPLADTDADPDQSLDRFLALKEDGLYVIDPGQSFQERKLYDFVATDPTRRAQFTSLGESTLVAVTRGQGLGRPEALLEVRDDEVIPYQWQPLPRFTVSYNELSGNSGLPENETFVWRIAFVLDDGSVGPASGPIESGTGAHSSGGTFEVELTWEEYYKVLPKAWRQRVSSIALIAHPPLLDDSGNQEVGALNQPGYKVATTDEIEQGRSLTYAGSIEDILSSEVYGGSGVRQHSLLAGAIYSYNKRLIAGDTAYDLYRPDLRRIIQWEEGTQNADGNDYWLLLQVKIRTASGAITRLSQPLPFDSTEATSVETRNGLVYYRDTRAFQWDLFVSEDYSGDTGAATWKRPLSDTRKEFQDADAANLSYDRTASNESWDITAFETTLTPITDETWTDQLHSNASEYESEQADGQSSDSPHDAYLDLYGENILASGEDASTVEFDIRVTEVEDEDGSTADADADASISVYVYDDDGSGYPGSVLQSASRSVEGSTTIQLDNYTAADAAHVRVYTEASASAGTTDSDDSATASADARAEEVRLKKSSGGNAETLELTQDVNQDNDRDPNRLIWSEPFRPYDTPAENLVYAGEENTDPILALQAVGQAVSEGQFGQYPVMVLQRDSIRMLEVGGDFITGVSPLTTKMGMVGRQSYGTVDGIVVVATDRGVYELQPQLQKPALSEPLHDIQDQFLDSLDADTALVVFTDERARRELWIGAQNRVWAYSLKHDAWSSLDRARTDFVRLNGKTWGVGKTNGTIEEEYYTDDVANSFTVVTGLEHFGEVGYLERLKELYIRQRFMMESMDWKLVTKDPNAAQALKSGPLNRATLPGGLTARDLLPNVLIKSGTLNRGDLGTIHLPKALGYSWFLRLEGSGKPDQGLEGFGATVDAKRRVRPRAFFPDQPETVILSFDVEPDDSSEPIKVRILDSTGSEASNIAAILWGDGTSDSSPDVVHTYDSAGTYTVQVVAQPNFEEAVTFNLGGPIDASTYATSDLIDLVEQRFDSAADAVKQPFNSPETGFFDNGTELFTSDTEIDVHLPDVPDRYTKVWLNDSPAYGDFSPPADAEEVIVSNTNITGETTQSKIPSNLRRLNIPSTDITINESALAAACGSTFRSLRIDNGVNKQNEKWNWDILLEKIPDLVEIRDGGQPEPSIAGSDANAEPYIKSNLEQLSTADAQHVLGAPTDFSEAKSLFRLVFRKNYKRNPTPFNSGEGYDEMLTDLHANRNVPPGGFDYTDLSLDIREHCGRLPTTEDPLVYTETLSQDSVDKALGLGAYHPSNGGEGLLDAGIAVDSRALYECETLTYVDDTTLTCDIPLRAQDFETILDEEFRESGGKLQVRTTQSDDPDNRDIVWEDVFQDGAGQQLRVFDKGNLSDLGLFEIQSATIDKSAERMTIHVVSGPLPDPLPGTLFSGRTWPTPAYCTP